MSVRLILDTSALHAYVAEDLRSVEVGELIRNVEENGDTCGIPALCLLAALKAISPADQAKLQGITADDGGPTVILPVMAGDVEGIARFAAHMPDAHAQAALEQAKLEALLGTYERSTYAMAIDEEDILDL